MKFAFFLIKFEIKIMEKVKLYYSHNGWLRVLGILLPYLIIVAICQFIVMLILGLDVENFEAIQSSKQKFIMSIGNLIGTFLVLFLFVKLILKENFIDLGFK